MKKKLEKDLEVILDRVRHDSRGGWDPSGERVAVVKNMIAEGREDVIPGLERYLKEELKSRRDSNVLFFCAKVLTEAEDHLFLLHLAEKEDPKDDFTQYIYRSILSSLENIQDKETAENIEARLRKMVSVISDSELKGRYEGWLKALQFERVKRKYAVRKTDEDRKTISVNLTGETNWLHELENDLRDFISEMLQQRYGIGWINLPQFKKFREKWHHFKTTKNERRVGGFEESRLIYYSDLGDLKELIMSNWDIFKPYFKKKEFIATRLDELTPIRDADAHGRPLSETEKGRVKQYYDDVEEVIREYRRKTTKIQDFAFPTIITVQDSLGNIQTNSLTKNKAVNWPGPYGTPPTISVGDNIGFIAKGFDPEGKPLKYRFSVQPMGGAFEVLRGWSADRTWIWKVEEKYIGPHIVVKVDVRGQKNHHWLGDVDDYTYLGYTVLPKRQRERQRRKREIQNGERKRYTSR